MAFDSVEAAISAIGRGEIVVVVDDAERENEGDLILAAEHATPDKVAFMVRHTSGVICATVPHERARELGLPLMVADNTESMRTAFTVSVDYTVGTTTGISAADRSATLRALADPLRKAGDFARPGHIFPLRVREGGVLGAKGTPRRRLIWRALPVSLQSVFWLSWSTTTEPCRTPSKSPVLLENTGCYGSASPI